MKFLKLLLITLFFIAFYGCSKDDNPVGSGNNGNTGTNILFQKIGVLDSLYFTGDTNKISSLGNFTFDTIKYVINYKVKSTATNNSYFMLHSTNQANLYDRWFSGSTNTEITDTVKCFYRGEHDLKYTLGLANVNCYLVIKDLKIYK